MERTIKIDPKQRENLAVLLRNKANDERTQLEAQNPVTASSVIHQIAKEIGIAPNCERIMELSKQISKLETESETLREKLRSQGINFDGDEFSTNYRAGARLLKRIQDALDGARRPIRESLKKYDAAIAKIWIAVNTEDLQKAVEGLI